MRIDEPEDDVGSDAPLDPRTIARIAALRDALDRHAGRPCARCDARLEAHEVLMAVAAGYRAAPRCLPCVAAGIGRPAAAIGRHMHRYMLRRRCWHTAWGDANAREGLAEGADPRCLLTAERAPDAAETEPELVPTQTDRASLRPDELWDAGEMACGELVLDLRLRMAAMQPGHILALTALDPGAREDIPAWCNLTRHTLLGAWHPHYLIRRRES